MTTQYERINSKNSFLILKNNNSKYVFNERITFNFSKNDLDYWLNKIMNRRQKKTEKKIYNKKIKTILTKMLRML